MQPDVCPPPLECPCSNFELRERPLVAPAETSAEAQSWLDNGLDDFDGPEQLMAFMFKMQTQEHVRQTASATVDDYDEIKVILELAALALLFFALVTWA